MKKHFIISIVLFSFIAFIASCSKKNAPAQKTVVVSEIFSKNCAGCHGPDGMSGHAPNLAKTKLDKAGILNIITNGEGHMPEFGDKLSSTEIGELSNWILTLKS